jgi:hypothetical protein
MSAFIFTFSASVFILISIFGANGIILSPQQMYSIRGLLFRSPLNDAQRASLQNLLYVTHENWAVKQAVQFKNLHKYKCRDITTEELVLSSKFGLLKSSKRYNGRTTFVRFSEIYVKSELLRTMTTRLSTTSCVSSKDRMRSVKNRDGLALQDKKIYRYADSVCNLEEPIPSKKQLQTDFYDFAWQFVDTLDAFTKYMVNLKYDYEFNKIRTNRNIAIMMCCSEETVRKAFNQFSEEMKQEILCSYMCI